MGREVRQALGGSSFFKLSTLLPPGEPLAVGVRMLVN